VATVMTKLQGTTLLDFTCFKFCAILWAENS